MISGLRSSFLLRCVERGYTLEQVRGCIISEDGETITVDETHASYPREKPGVNGSPGQAADAIQSGPGAELHSMLRDWLGIEPTADCPCRSMAGKMDRLGPEWCESDEGMAEILATMRAEHAKRREQGTTILLWTDYGAKQLVLLACRRARAKSAG